MSTRSERIKALIEQSGMSYQDLEKLTGVKKSSHPRYAAGDTPKTPLDVTAKLPSAFNVSQAYLMGWDEKKDSPSELQLTEGEEMLLALFNRVPKDKQQLVLQMIRAALSSQE